MKWHAFLCTIIQHDSNFGTFRLEKLPNGKLRLTNCLKMNLFVGLHLVYFEHKRDIEMNKFLKIGLIITASLALVFFGFMRWTKSKSPEATAVLEQNGLKITVKYAQPQKRGRVVFGQVVKFGQVWRTGANEATEIEISRDVTVAGKPLKAGKYSLWTVPTAATWAVILNSETGQWGTQHDAARDVLRVDVPATPTAETEALTIGLVAAEGGADMTIAWDKTAVSVPIR